MSIKNLFNKTTVVFESAQSASLDVESSDFVAHSTTANETFLPAIDFTTASNFVKYGSAELYYENAIKRVYQQYPYDGSEAEKLEYGLSSSALDKWILDYKYPKTTGYVLLGKSYGAQGTTIHEYETYANTEYIKIQGGMHTASAGMIGKPLVDTFDESVVYHSASNRTKSLRVNLASGSTVEFWLKKPTYKASGKYETIFDLWNTELSSSAKYGRMRIEAKNTGAGSPFYITFYSGSTGFFQQQIGASTLSKTFDWTHFAFSFVNDSSKIRARLYVNGEENANVLLGNGSVGEIAGAINANIAALIANPSGSTYHNSDPDIMLGYGRLTGSMDEFRFWKTRRTSEQIQKNYFHPIGGGQNKSHPDELERDLGVYYKFNEGITLTSSTDSVILDYSGRLANGSWTGYPGSTSRNTGSAMVSASVLTVEPPDPIIYSSHPDVVTLLADMQESGSMHDRLSGSFIYDTIPEWIRNEDVEGTTKALFQIVGSYFDTLYSQISYLDKLQDKQYYDLDSVEYETRPTNFPKRLLESKGLMIPELFPNSSVLNLFMQRDEKNLKFEDKLQDIKNVIYQNIYNNLEHIYKTKGTSQSYRNLLRCFGIDDEILKLNIYTDKGTHYFRDNVKHTSVKKKFIDFNHTTRFSGSLYQTSSYPNWSFTYFSGSKADKEQYSSMTYEVEVIAPHKLKPGEKGYFETNFTTASVFGQHEAVDNQADYSWKSGDACEFQVFLIREESNSDNAYFMLTSSTLSLEMTSSTYANIYDNEKWNLAVRIKPSHFPIDGGVVSPTPPLYRVEFYGVNYAMDTIQSEFSLTESISNTLGKNFLDSHKRIYAGAHLTNFTGAVRQQTDLQIGSTRVWMDYLDNGVIRDHALDPKNYGASKKSYQNSTMFATDLTGKHVPRYATLALHWTFDTVTGSDSNGVFVVDDFSSGSNDQTDIKYTSWLDDVIRRENRGAGINFPNSSTTMLSNEYLFASKKQLPEISISDDRITIKGDEQKFFIEDDDVSDNFYALEKSMYGIISEEMLDTFSTIADFSNMIGKYQDRYKSNYKRLDHFRQLFYERIDGDMDFDRFVSYYKWIDASISILVRQLIPVSARVSDNISNMIESHVLERNKYQSKFPLTQRYESTEGRLKGRGELEYNWKFGHATKQFSTATITIGNPVTAGEKIVFGDGVKTPKTYTFVASSPSSNEILIDSALQVQRNLIKSRLETDFDVTVTADTVMLVTNNNAAPPYQLTSTLTTPNKVVGFTKAFLENKNCLWWKERAERDGSLISSGVSAIDTQRDTIRRVVVSDISSSGPNLAKADKTIYEGSAYAIRKFAKPFRMRVSEQQVVHLGTNYNRRKERDVVHNAVHIHGPLDSISNVPLNVMMVGLGTGTGLLDENDCDDLQRPDLDSTGSIIARRKKRHSFVEMARSYKEDYYGVINGDMVLPFNIYSSSVEPPGADKVVWDNYASNTIFTNLHEDTYGNLNDIGVQGPFTRAWVGGHQHRHVDLNRYDTSLAGNLDGEGTRPEAWRVITLAGDWTQDPNASNDPDKIFGLIGPDYGGPYPDPNRQYAVRYRDERAKRPLNIKNIQTIRPQLDSTGSFVTSSTGQYMTGSPVQGNFYSNYEVVQTCGRHANNLWLRKAFDTATGSLDVDKQVSPFLPEAMRETNSLIYGDSALLSDATHFSALYGRRPTRIHNDGNIFLREPKYVAEGNSQTAIYCAAFNTNANACFKIAGNLVSYWLDKTSQPGPMDKFTFSTWVFPSSVGVTSTGDFYTIFRFGIQDDGVQINLVQFKGPSGDQYRIEAIFAGHAQHGYWLTNNLFDWDVWRHIIVHPPPKGAPSANPVVYVDGVLQEGTWFQEFAPALSPAASGPSHLYVDEQFPDLLPPIANAGINLRGFVGYAGDTTLWWHPLGLKERFAKRLYNRGYLIDPRVLSDDVKIFWFTMGRFHLDKQNNLGSSHVYSVLDSPQNPILALVNRLPISTNPLPVAYASLSGLAADAPIVVDTSAYCWEYAFDKNPSLTGSNSNSVIVNRFSAPGGPEIMSRGFLDAASGEYSVYNALPWRNTSVLGNKLRTNTVFDGAEWVKKNNNFGGSGETSGIRVVDHLGNRHGLRAHLARHCGKYGTDTYETTEATIVDSTITLTNYNTAINKPSFHKQQKNPSYIPSRLSGKSTLLYPDLEKIHDNGYVNTPIPRSDFQYTWITASIGSNLSYGLKSGKQKIYGYAPRSGVVYNDEDGDGERNYLPAITFPSASEIIGV